MAKAYWIARIDVGDSEAYQAYAVAAKEILESYGATYLARGGEYEAAEGDARARNVVVEFPSLARAQACFHSPEYQLARELRAPVSEGEIVLVQGV